MIKEAILKGVKAACAAPQLTILSLAFIAGACLSLSVIGPHPYVVIRRVSMPYGLRIDNLGIATLAASWGAMILGVIPFLRTRLVPKYCVALASTASVAGLLAGVLALSGFERAAYVITSLYVAGIPSTKVWYVTLAVCAATGAVTVLSKVRPRTDGLNTLSRVKVFKGAPLTLSDALTAWLTAFIILMAPYYPWLNPRGVLIDVDHIYYWRWLRGTDWSNLTVRLLEFNHGDRPLFVGSVFLVTRLIPFRVFDVLYIAGAGALTVTLAEGVCRRVGVGRWFGFTAALLASIPLYFVYGGYHANLAAMCLTLATLYWRLGWGDERVKPHRLAVLGLASLATAMTHSEAWVLYVPLFMIDAPTLTAWVAGGASWLLVREFAISPKYVVLAKQLLAHGAPTITQLDFQLVIMLWGVPATWLTYLLATAGIVKAWVSGDLRKYSPFLTSTALTLIPLLTITPKFMVHRVLMNTAYWFFTAYALSQAWGSRRSWWVVPLYAGLQWMYVAWLLSNAVPAKPP